MGANFERCKFQSCRFAGIILEAKIFKEFDFEEVIRDSIGFLFLKDASAYRERWKNTINVIGNLVIVDHDAYDVKKKKEERELRKDFLDLPGNKSKSRIDERVLMVIESTVTDPMLVESARRMFRHRKKA